MSDHEPQDPLERALRSRLYRMACPAPEVLGEWYLGLCEDAEAIAEHVRSCPHCTEEVRQLAALLALGVREPPVRRLVASLFSGPLPGAPAFALRGVASLQAATYAAEGYVILVGIEPDPQDPGLRTVLGMVTGCPEPGAAQVFLRSEDVDRTASVDDVGQFVFPEVTPGRYDLLVRFPDVEIQAGPMDVR
jgi:hypothetical protein